MPVISGIISTAQGEILFDPALNNDKKENPQAQKFNFRVASLNFET